MDRTALIVAHGQPSDPGPAAADLTALAAATEAHAPGWRIAGATLAEPGAVERAARTLRPALVVPLFMADGWFTRRVLPERLTAAPTAQILPPFGTWPETAALALTVVQSALSARGWRPEESALLLAAHGSQKSRGSAQSTEAIAAHVAAGLALGALTCGYLEEAPSVTEAARGLGPRTLCLPLFIAHWGHVDDDLPAALAAAGFRGDTLPALGARPEVPALLAARLEASLGDQS